MAEQLPAGAPPGLDPYDPASSPQLTQARVPLDRAGDALAQPDASGRVPIVVQPRRLARVNVPLAVGGIVAVCAALVLPVQALALAVIAAAGVVALVAGIVPSFFVSIPEGSQGLLVRRGRYFKPIRSGTHVLRPGIGVSHIVTTREIPFDAAVSRVVTSDDVRVDVDILLTFRISEPERFVYAIASRDFDQVFQGTCQEAVRRLVRGIAIDGVLDLAEGRFEDAARGDRGTARRLRDRRRARPRHARLAARRVRRVPRGATPRHPPAAGAGRAVRTRTAPPVRSRVARPPGGRGPAGA